ncbi:tRNA (guanosine(46)-N7)-methyltransferase TrmB [Candidatus Arthromitus sp. SFB-turkey]|uniref:tRNA (guanosine(46)-N7)-methyltransferase TrmB n=1 Tax=Candidatus Arthromitus sp. SFB-turkey TaxID=1840217 RepID=UPI0007F51B85|nr:tRNA (guanosine(46)-N7)-methyltransferase TrmB [Candidatus Arthromitus sp. SFB-turkey]OAT88883.1 tRNA (guanosine(46)-N7)-methyltransferase TrmB [Candidatus Arthromitus sp. SFB-turkey]
MRLRRKPWARPELLQSELFIENPREFKGSWNKVFNNNNEICLELGCGKGRFISNIAQKNKDKNFIAIDLKDEVLVYVKRKCEELNLENVRILSFDINYINEIFEKGEVSDIYLNFSTPWPKTKHNKRRLTHPRFLNKYLEIINSNSKIMLKTDHELFFLDSIEYLNENGFDILYKTMDLHNEEIENIMTEYEEKFLNKGMKIMYLTAKFNERKK